MFRGRVSSILLATLVAGRVRGVSPTPGDTTLQPARSPKASIAQRHRYLFDDDEPVTGIPNAGLATDILQERLTELNMIKYGEFPRRKVVDLPSVGASSPLDSLHDSEPALAPSEDALLAHSGSSAEEGAGGGERVPKLFRALQRACFASRRESIRLISQGCVRVNNKITTDAFATVSPSDDIHVEGVKGRVRFAPPRLWMFHKPRFVSTSAHEASGRAVITKYTQLLGFDHLIPILPIPFAGHGLMMFTNDGSLAEFMNSPTSGLQLSYRLRVTPPIEPSLAQKFNEKGIQIDGVFHKNYQMTVDPHRSANYVKVKVRREELPVHEVMKHLGRTVKRGGRTSIGMFELASLPMGVTKEVPIPPYLLNSASVMWKPFVERDWPFFRRNRAKKLKLLAQTRPLSPAEMAELDGFTFDELRDSLNPLNAAGSFSTLRNEKEGVAVAAGSSDVDEAFIQLEMRNVRPMIDEPFLDMRL